MWVHTCMLNYNIITFLPVETLYLAFLTKISKEFGMHNAGKERETRRAYPRERTLLRNTSNSLGTLFSLELITRFRLKKKKDFFRYLGTGMQLSLLDFTFEAFLHAPMPQ